MWSMTPAEQRPPSWSSHAAEPAQGARAAAAVQADRDDIGADSGAVSAPAWLAHATRTTTSSRHRDLHLAAKLDGPVRGHPAGLRRGDHRPREGWHHHRRSRGALGGVRRPASRDRGARGGAPDRPGHGLRCRGAPEAGEAAVRGGLPGGGRRGRGREAGQGGSPGPCARALLGARQGRWHQRGPLQTADAACAPAEEGSRGADLPAAPGRRAGSTRRPGKKLAARHAAGTGADRPAREPPHRAAERERLPVHHAGHHRCRRADVRPRAGRPRHRDIASRPAKPVGWPAGPGSSRWCSDGDSIPTRPGQGAGGSSTATRRSRSTIATTAAPRTPAIGHRPGSSSITRTPGAGSGRRMSRTASPCARRTTGWPTTRRPTT